jgi:hypothetical protein
MNSIDTGVSAIQRGHNEVWHAPSQGNRFEWLFDLSGMQELQFLSWIGLN